jgi:hypothetical protein
MWPKLPIKEDSMDITIVSKGTIFNQNPMGEKNGDTEG